MFLDRAAELAFLRDVLTRRHPGPGQFIMLYGRRRVGKSTLIQHWIEQSGLPFTYWAGPGVWWSQYVRGGSWWPGSGTILTHSARATVRPQYPSRLGPGKSWFGTFSGSLAKVPKDRLLRIGFGTLVLPSNVRLNTGYLPREVALSTTHQFRLPKRR